MLRTLLFSGLTLMVLTAPTAAINITVDYRYDTNNFFDTQPKRDALQAAADRYSEIITTSLSAATFANNSTDPRIGFTHPSTGQSWQVSPATSSSNDAIVQAGASIADEYRGPWTIAEDQWVLYAGGQPLSNAGEGGTGTGVNFTTVFDDGQSHLNRGFRSTGSVSNLPLWGGAITFDSGRDWHFDLDTAGASGTLDFYTIAIHEIGHALGLSSGWQEWSSNSSGDQFIGANAVAAANADNGTSLTDIDLVSADNPHFADNDGNLSGGGDIPADPDAIQSFIFNGGTPQLAGTGGLNELQDLLLEPIANTFFDLGNPANSRTRFELTNVDVAALEDIGWSVIEAVPTQIGDYNGDLLVTASDYAIWRDTAGTPEVIGSYAEWSSHFGAGAAAVASISVPEPLTALPLLLGVAMTGRRRASAS